MKKTKKFRLQVHLFTLILFALTGCGNKSTTSSESSTKYLISASEGSETELDETPVEDFSYKYNSEIQGVEITQYKGSSIKVRIPDEIEGEPVTGIGIRAFANAGISHVYIPNTVKSIDSSAFCFCTGLTSITIPENVTVLSGSGTGGAFSHCTGLISVEILGNVTKLGAGTFQECENLTNIEIPDSVTQIGSSAFSRCTSLTSIKIPDGVTEIEGLTFNECTSLTSIEIPDSVTQIGSSAFNKCTSLTSIKIPDGVTEIGDLAFCECTSLTNIEIPDSVTAISLNAFRQCTSLSDATKQKILSINPDSYFE